jgi:hypothetical protein
VRTIEPDTSALLIGRPNVSHVQLRGQSRVPTPAIILVPRIEARKRRAEDGPRQLLRGVGPPFQSTSQNCVAGSLGEHDTQFSTVRASKRKFTPNDDVTRYLDLDSVLRIRIETVDHEGAVHVRDHDGTFTKGDVRYDFNRSAGYDAMSITHYPLHADESLSTREY